MMNTNREVNTDESNAPIPEDRLLTTQELMAFLNMSRTKIWTLVKKSNLPAYKIGGDYRYRMSEILAWLKPKRVTDKD